VALSTLSAPSSPTATPVGWLGRLVANRARVLLVLVLTSLLAHLPFAGVAPGGTHLWRQANTLTVARNLAEEELNIFRPRVDRRYDTDGVTGMQFPSYEYVVAVLYRTIGFSEAIPRLVNLALLLLAAVALYDVGWRLSGSRWLAAIAAWGLAWSPEFFYMGFVALPDVLALAASVVGFAGFLRWQQTRSAGAWGLALLGFTLAGLTKLQFLAIGVPVAVMVGQEAWRGAYTRRQLGALLVLGAVSVLVSLAWYAYALQLIKASGLMDFGLEVRPATSLPIAAEILWRNVRSQFPEDLIGYASTALLVAGLVAVWREPKVRAHRFFWPAVAWAGALLAYHLVELQQMRYHVYYMFPYLPLVMLTVGLGADWLRSRLPMWAIGSLLLLMPLLTMIRILPSRWMHPKAEAQGVPTDRKAREALATAVPLALPAIVGPDDSGCIMFYLLHRKGFGFEQPGQLAAQRPIGADSTAALRWPWLDAAVRPIPYRREPSGTGFPLSESRLHNFIRRGARVLYTTDSSVWQTPALQPLLGRLVRREGPLRVYLLRVPTSLSSSSASVVAADASIKH
jgi:hypothetical protein